MICVLIAGLTATGSKTRWGVHCPTAALQRSIEQPDRAPQPGEVGFTQCRCNEKKATAAKESASPTASSNAVSGGVSVSVAGVLPAAMVRFDRPQPLFVTIHVSLPVVITYDLAPLDPPPPRV